MKLRKIIGVILSMVMITTCIVNPVSATYAESNVIYTPKNGMDLPVEGEQQAKVKIQ